MHDAPSSSPQFQYTRRLISSPFGISHRPQYKHASTVSLQGVRAKSAFTKVKSVYFRRGPGQHDAQSEPTTQSTSSNSEPQVNHRSPGARASSEPKPTSPKSEAPKRPLVRRTVSKEHDRSIARKVVVNTDSTEKTPSKSQRKKPAVENQKQEKQAQKADERVPLIHKEMLQQHKSTGQEIQNAYRQRRNLSREGKQAQKETREGAGFTVRRVAITQLSSADTGTRDVRLTAEVIGERARLSGKVLARLTEQLRLVTGLKGSELEGLRRWKTRDKAQAASVNKTKSLVRTVKLGSKAERDSSRRITWEPPSHTKTTRHSLHATDLQQRIRQHRSPEGLDFIMQSIPLDLNTSTTPPEPRPHYTHPLGKIFARVRNIITQTSLLTARLSTHLPNTPLPVPISKHAAKPLSVPRAARNTARARRAARSTRSTPHRRLRAALVNRPLSEKIRYGDGAALAAHNRRQLRVRVVRHVYRGRRERVRVRRLGGRVMRRRERERERERRRGLEDEVGEWLGGGGEL